MAHRAPEGPQRFACDAFAAIARLAPQLGEAELRVLIALTKLYADGSDHAVVISSRDLAEATRVSRRNVQRALDSLTFRNLIARRDGTATKPAEFALRFLETLVLGGAVTTPPPVEMVASEKRQGGVEKTPQAQIEPAQEALFQRLGGAITTPPIYKERAPARASIDSISTSIIDRLLKADLKNLDPREIAEARRWVHGYQAKAGREKNPHPPDDKIMAQLLAVAGLSGTIRLVQDLMAERKEPGHHYSWYVTVALQRFHGIQPEELKQRRAELRLVRQPGPPAIAGEQQPLIDESPALQADPQFTSHILDRVAAAGRKLP